MSSKTLFITIGVILAAVIGLVIFAGSRVEENGIAEPASNNVFGNPESKVVLVEAYSLACPACGSFHPILKEIREEYEDRILFQVVHYTLSGTSRSGGLQNAKAAHRAVEAAARQGKFWEMHDILFENQSLWTVQTTSDPIPQIKVFAEEIGLDMAQFEADFSSAEVNSVITDDEKYLRSLDVNETPTFFLSNDGEIEKADRIESSRLAGVDIARRTLNAVLEAIEEDAAEETASPSSNHIVGSDAQGVFVMEAYSLACPGCANFRPLLEQIHEEYGDRVQFQVVHYPLRGNFDNAEAAHRAAEAASRQGKFWEMQDLLFERQQAWRDLDAGALDQQLETYADEIGLDVEQFRADFASAEVAAVVMGDEQYLDDNFDITRTPTFILNGEQLQPSQFASIESVRQTLDQALGDESSNEEG